MAKQWTPPADMVEEVNNKTWTPPADQVEVVQKKNSTLDVKSTSKPSFSGGGLDLNSLTGGVNPMPLTPITDDKLRTENRLRELQYNPIVKNAQALGQQNQANLQANPPAQSDQKRGFLDQAEQALYLPAFNKGFNDLVVKPYTGAVDFTNRTINKISNAIVGHDAPEWLTGDGKGNDLLHNTVKYYDDAYNKRDKPTNLLSETAEGVMGTLPLMASLATGSGEASMATKAPQLVSKLTGLLATTKALSAYKDATDENKGYVESLKEAGKGAVEGGKEGLALEAQMMVGGALGKGVANKLAEKGLMVGGKASEAVLHALGVGTVFGGTSAGDDLMQGKDINTHEAMKQFGMGLAFELPGIAKGVTSEIGDAIESKRLNKKALQAAAVSNAASNLHSESVLRTLSDTPKDQLLAINDNIKDGHEDLYANSIEQGAKAYEAKTPDEKKQLYTNQLLLKTQGDVKYMADKLADLETSKDVIDQISESQEIPDEQKADLIDKVQSLSKNPIPNEEPTPTTPTEVPLSETTPQADAGNVPDLATQSNEVNNEAPIPPVSEGQVSPVEAAPQNEPSDVPAMAGPTDEAVTKPTEQQVLDDLKNKRFATFTYDKESDVPNELKDKISSVGEINGKKTVKVTLPQSEADYLLSKKNEQTPANPETAPDVQGQSEQQVSAPINSEAPVETVTPKTIDQTEIKPSKPLERPDVIEKIERPELSHEPRKLKTDPYPLIQPKNLKGSDYDLALAKDQNDKWYIVDKNSGVIVSKTYDGKYEAINAYVKAADKLSPEVLKSAISDLKKPVEADISSADEKQPITEREKAEDVAKKILSKKFKVKGGNMNSFAKGVGEIVWNGALDAAAAVVRAKGSIHDAINAAVRHIKEHTENKNNREMYYAIRKELQDTGLVEHSDIDYTQELKDASLTQKQLATKGKADDLYKELSEIKPATLTPDEIVHYNNIMNDSKADRSELATFLDDVHARQDEEAQQREKDWYKQLRNDEDLDGEDVKGALSEAAKLPEISPDDTESTIDEKSNLSSTKDNNIAKKALSKLLTFGRKELKDTELPSEMDEVKKALLDLDESKLSTKQLRDLNRTIEAMINDHNYAGSGKWLALDQSVKNAADILSDTKKRGFEQGKTSQFAADFRSLDQNVEIIAKNTKGASVIQNKSGIQDISAGNAKVNKTMNDISKEFNNLTKGMPKDIQSVDNRYKRGILSLFTQQADTDSAQDHFDRYKEYVSTTAKRLLKSTKKSEQREGQLIQDLYDKYVDKATTSEEVINGLTKDNANNAKIVNFFINKYKSVYPELRKNTLLYGGKDLPSIANYTATSMKMLRGEEDTGEPTFSITNPVSFDADQNVNTDQSRTTITRKKGMGNSRVLNLNFDGLQLNKLRESHYDIQTLASRHLYDAIRNQPDFKEALAGKKNVGVISEGVANMVQRQRGFNKTSPEARAAMQVLNIATAKGIRAALFGIAQPLKQYPSVAINTLLNLGNDIDLYAKSMMRIGQHNPIYDQSGIGLRGGQKGGTEFELKQRQLQNADFENNTIKALSAISYSGDWISNKLSYALSKSDDVVARHSWGAYYMKSLRQQGIDVNKVDWANEHKDINKEAAAYAEQQVSRNQIQNDATKQADFLYNGNVATAKDVGYVVFKGLTMPFSSFARNAQARLESDLRKFSGGDKKEATRSIISGVAEAAAFNTIKYIVIAPLVQAAASSLLTSFGYKKPKEKTLGESAMEIPAQSLNDFMLSGFGQMGDYWTIRGVNGIYSKIKKNPDAQLMKQFDPNVFGDPDFGMAGVYGILPSKIYQAHQEANYVDGSPTELKGAYDADKGSYEYKKVKGHLSNKQTHLAQLTMLVDMLGLMGLSDAEALRINQKIFREIKKQKEPVKTFKKDYINKNSASAYEDDANAAVNNIKPEDKAIKKIKLSTGAEYELNDSQVAYRQKINEAYIQKNKNRLNSFYAEKATHDKDLLKKIKEETKDKSADEKKTIQKELVNNYINKKIKVAANKHSLPITYHKYKDSLKVVDE